MLDKYEAVSVVEDSIYQELVRKLCHIRVAEFLSSTKQRMASEKGNASLAGQNLRDELLTSHNNLSSHASY